jgi:hypothetical protein
VGIFWWLPFGKVPEVSARQLDTMRAHGTRAVQFIAVRLLQRHGFKDVFELHGDMQASQRAGLPVEDEAGGRSP